VQLIGQTDQAVRDWTRGGPAASGRRRGLATKRGRSNVSKERTSRVVEDQINLQVS
jgi:hypothetical protein